MTEKRRPIALEGQAKQALETGRNRLIVAGAVFACAFVAIGWRLVDLTVLTDPAVEQRASTREVVRPLSMQRADIADRNGVLLATNLKTASLYANPRRVLDAADAARRLRAVFPELSEAELQAKLTGDRSFVWLKRNLTPRQQDRINRLGIPGVDFRTEERRVYPHGALTAHVVGFAGIDNVGLSGVEQTFDTALRERRGPLRLALDVRVQQIMREELGRQIVRHDGIGGAGIVMDVHTGETLALVSLPDFDPNEPGTATDETRFNRATLGVYELGSVFKIFNHALALESGMRMDAGFDASKPIRAGRFSIRDYRPKARWLSVPEIFMFSSNIGSAKMALEVGGPAQKAFLGRLGLLRRTSIELPEAGQPMYPQVWRDINTMTVAFGHGIAVSPLHLATAVAAVANGGTLRPATLIRGEDDRPRPGTRVLSAAVSDQVRRLMWLVVRNGANPDGKAPGYLLGGKTGTAEKLENGRYKRGQGIASFVGVFPITAPRFLVYALVDEPKGIEETHGYATGGWVAAPAVARMVERLAALYGIAPQDESAPAVRQALMVEIKSQDPKVAAF